MISLDYNKNELEGSIEKSKNWLIYSGIQNLNSNSLEVKGGFNSWYDLDKKDYFYTYSEISGYSLSMLLFLNSIEKNNLYLTRSILAAEWLLDKASHEKGGLKTRYYFDRKNAPKLYDFSGEVLHSFDNGIALSGLMDLYKNVNEERYLESGKKIGDFLVDIMQKKDGGFYASYNHKDKESKDTNEKWSTQSGSFHAKIALGLLKLYGITKDEKYREATIKLCNNSLKFQEDNGRFISYKEEKDTHLHPHCYSAEGLLYSGLYFNDDSYLKGAEKAVKWALDIQMDNGGIPSMYIKNDPIKYERSDVLAQVLRLGVIMTDLGMIDKKYIKNLDKLEKRLLSFKYNSKDIRSNGGFLYGYDIDYRNNLEINKKNHLNTWCTMFALQSLVFYKGYLEENFHFDKDTLI